MIKPKAIQYRTAKLARFKDGAHTIKISFPYDPADVSLIKGIPGRKWHKAHKIWTCPPTQKSLEILTMAAFLIDPKLRTYINTLGTNRKTVEVPGLKKNLFEYQKAGIAFVDSVGGRALIGDDMGIGKTIQAIGYLQLRSKIRPAVIVCPAVVKLNWAKEIKAWMGHGENMVEILSGKTPWLISGDILIINYDILNAWKDTLLALEPKILILDECQAIKNGTAQRTKAARKLSREIPYLIALSGTPINNRPVEFFNVIQMVNADLFPNWMEYTRKYCDRKHSGFGWDVSGASNTEELHQILSGSIMIRRTKAEVLTELPDKIRSFFPLEMHPAGAKEYAEAEKHFIAWVRSRKGAEAAEKASQAAQLTQIEALKQVAANAKLSHAMEWIDEFLDTGEKLVVFATHHEIIDALMKNFKDEAVKLDGRTPPNERQNVVDAFQNDDRIRLFVGNIKAAGVGITLTAASNVAFLEFPWTSGEVMQAEDRCHRIGQKSTVNIYYLFAEGTIEEKLIQLLDKKAKILNQILDGASIKDHSAFVEFIENYIS